MPISRPTGISLALPSPVHVKAAGAFVGLLSSQDPDPRATFTYSTTDSRFLINGNRLELQPGVALSYNMAHAVMLKVTTTDQAGHRFTGTVSVPLSGSALVVNAALHATDGTTPTVPGTAGGNGGNASVNWGEIADTGTNDPNGDTWDIHANAQGGAGGTGAQPDVLTNSGGQNPQYVHNGSPGGFGGNASATVHDVSLNTLGGTDTVTLEAAAIGGNGGAGSPGSYAQGGTGAAGAHGGNASATVQDNSIIDRGVGSLTLSLVAHATAGDGGAGGDGWAVVNTFFGVSAASAGDASFGGNAFADVSGNLVQATKTTLPGMVLLEALAKGGDGGHGGDATHQVGGGVDTQADNGDGGAGGNALASIIGNTVLLGPRGDLVVLHAHATAGLGGIAVPNTGFASLFPSLNGAAGTARVVVDQNSIKLGYGDDLLVLDLGVTGQVAPGSAGALGFTTANAEFSGNLFDGGVNFDTLDLSLVGSGATAPALRVDVALNKLSVPSLGSATNIIKNFEKFIGNAAGDRFIDGVGDQIYVGNPTGVFSFNPNHGVDVVADFNALDVVEFHGFGSAFQNFGQLLAASTNVSGVVAADGVAYSGVMVATPLGGGVLLAGVTTGSLVAGEFLFF
jgi:hypothetical protein